VSALLLKAIAVVPARAMLGPNAHAHPAEFVPAFAACHVVASAILLDCRIALGALLCICGYPVRSLRVILALLHPLLHEAAWCRLVICEGAAEAEVVSTVALHGWDDSAQVSVLDFAVYSEDAVWRRAPL